MTQTEQERFDRFQKFVQETIAGAIKSAPDHGGPYDRISKESLQVLPYYKEIQESNIIRKLLESSQSIENTGIISIRQSLEQLIPLELETMAKLNCLSDKYIHEARDAMFDTCYCYFQRNLPGLIRRRNINTARKEIIKISRIQIMPDNIKYLINYIREIKENYLYDTEISTPHRSSGTRATGWAATWSSEPRPIWSK